jgi:hypothetical protein
VITELQDVKSGKRRVISRETEIYGNINQSKCDVPVIGIWLGPDTKCEIP